MELFVPFQVSQGKTVERRSKGADDTRSEGKGTAWREPPLLFKQTHSDSKQEGSWVEKLWGCRAEPVREGQGRTARKEEGRLARVLHITTLFSLLSLKEKEHPLALAGSFVSCARSVSVSLSVSHRTSNYNKQTRSGQTLGKTLSFPF